MIWLLLDSRTFGGIETHVLLLAKQLITRKRETCVIFLNHYGEHPLHQELKKYQIPYVILNGSFLTLLRYTCKHKPKLLHAHGYKANIFTRLIGKLLHVPVITTHHAGIANCIKVDLYNWLDRRLAFLSKNIAVSYQISALLGKKTYVVPNFVEIPAAPNASTPNNRIAFVGRISIEKGPDLFCELATYLEHAALFMYGEGPLQATLQKTYAGKVLFRDAPQSMVAEWANIDLLCVTSRGEGIPIAVLEAMSFGIPVAAFAVGGLPEIIIHNHNGFLATPGNTQELASYINHYLNLPLSHKHAISKQARKTIAQKFSAEIIMPKILAIYAQALKK